MNWIGEISHRITIQKTRSQENSHQPAEPWYRVEKLLLTNIVRRLVTGFTYDLVNEHTSVFGFLIKIIGDLGVINLPLSSSNSPTTAGENNFPQQAPQGFATPRRPPLTSQLDGDAFVWGAASYIHRMYSHLLCVTNNQYDGWLVNHPSYEWSIRHTPHKFRHRLSIFTHSSPILSTYIVKQSTYFATHRYFSSTYPLNSPYMSIN